MGIAQGLSRFDNKLRHRLAKVLPAKSFVAMYSMARSPMLDFLSKERLKNGPISDVPSFPIEFCGIHFRNDLGNAAGYDKDGKMIPLNYLMGAGFAIVGTVLIAPHEGNYFSSLLKINPWTPLPFSHGAINSLGLPSKGVDDVVKNIDKFRNEYAPSNFPIGASIMGHPKQDDEEKVQGTVECLKRLLPYVDFVEINESCPNVNHCACADDLEQILSRLRLEKLIMARDVYQSESGRKIPLFVKLGSFGDIEHTIRFMTNLGIDGLVGVNTQKNYCDLRNNINKNDLKIFDYYTKNHNGGVSGEPIRDFAYEQIKAAALEIAKQKSPIKLIHVGGIRTSDDIKRSRDIGDIVILREWYTGMMEMMADKPYDQVYKKILSDILSEDDVKNKHEPNY